MPDLQRIHCLVCCCLGKPFAAVETDALLSSPFRCGVYTCLQYTQCGGILCILGCLQGVFIEHAQYCVYPIMQCYVVLSSVTGQPLSGMGLAFILYTSVWQVIVVKIKKWRLRAKPPSLLPSLSLELLEVRCVKLNGTVFYILGVKVPSMQYVN